MRRFALPLAFALALPACADGAEDSEGPPPVSADEARALEEAAEMIEGEALPDEVLEAAEAEADAAEAAR